MFQTTIIDDDDVLLEAALDRSRQRAELTLDGTRSAHLSVGQARHLAQVLSEIAARLEQISDERDQGG